MRKVLAALPVLLPFIFFTGCDSPPPADTRTVSQASWKAGKADDMAAQFAPDPEVDYPLPEREKIESEELNSGSQPPEWEQVDNESEHDPGLEFLIDLPESCTSPCVLSILTDDDGLLTRVEFEVSGMVLAAAYDTPFSIEYHFSEGGRTIITARGFSGPDLLVEDTAEVWVNIPQDSCQSFDSTEADAAPVQVTGPDAPPGSLALNWVPPAEAIYYAPFNGTPGQPALHEGMDYIHNLESQPYIPVYAASDGTVVYVREGCPQTHMFTPNIDSRECGSGWGNHVVIDHGNGIHTRYSHLAPTTITVRAGESVLAGDLLGEMGNTGRSETRHLHFELGVAHQAFDPCAPSQSLDTVYDPSSVGL